MQGISCFDLTPAFLRARQESPESFYKTRDPHWTVRGNRVAAEAQAAHLPPPGSALRVRSRGETEADGAAPTRPSHPSAARWRMRCSWPRRSHLSARGRSPGSTMSHSIHPRPAKRR